MKHSLSHSLHRILILLALAVPASLQAQFTDPTPAELSMTSIPQVPGAPAVYLYREEITEDQHSMFSIYTRLKILTEKGLDEANIELPYYKMQGGFRVDSIQGRTIHADGTIVPLTTKPYDKLIAHEGDLKYMSKVFTMPAVEVGSIIEYRYKLHAEEGYVRAPDWYIQSNYYTLKAHYFWQATGDQIILRHGLSNRIAWVPILPKGAQVVQSQPPTSGLDHDKFLFELNIADVPPSPREEFMPPIDSFTYRVVFYYTAATSAADFWKDEGKYWSRDRDNFIGPKAGVKSAVQQLLTPAEATPDQKLRKLYDAIMQMENTDFTRERSRAEEKAAGLKDVKTSDDILARKRGSGDELTGLFIAMARAAGLKAYAMGVTNRDRSIFLPAYLTTRQLDDLLAVVVVDGKDMYFDPGQRYCEYGHLAWKHSLATGLRQTDRDAIIANTPAENYKFSTIKRIGDLVMNDKGDITGSITVTSTGDSALSWRHIALQNDAQAMHKRLRQSVESLIPNTLEITLGTIEQLDSYSQPLVVHYNVTGRMGTFTGKRLLLPANLFEANAKPAFTLDTRTTPVYYHFAHVNADAVRIKFPASFSIESAPQKQDAIFKKRIGYTASTETTANSFTARRTFTLGDVVFETPDYKELREFYTKMETHDQEPIVLLRKQESASLDLPVKP